ncbi:MAG: nucleotide sugar dehydrogenase [Chthonomonas sp.]
MTQNPFLRELLAKIAHRSCTVGVVGMGRVGLPFAVEAAKAGFNVVGVDTDPERVASLKRGVSYVEDVPSSEIKALVLSGKLQVFGEIDDAPDFDVLTISIATKLDKSATPDLSGLTRVAAGLCSRLRAGVLISCDSTVYPGATEEIFQTSFMSTGLTPDKDFFLAHSPERVDPGNRAYSEKTITRVVGGIGPNSVAVAKAFYEAVLDRVHVVSSTRVAELTKLYENTFRAVNIGLVNEMLRVCDHMGLDVWEILDAANTKPFGIMRFLPGPGVGGDCVELDSHLLEWKAREYNFPTRFVGLATDINRSMPAYVIERLWRILNDRGLPVKGSKVLVIGASYKRDVADLRESPAVRIMDMLTERGAVLAYHDPMVPSLKTAHLELKSVQLTPETLSHHDVVMILTDHSTVDYALVAEHSNLVFDTRGATRNVGLSSPRIHLL